MNPLTLVKRIQNINAKEASLGISEDASWHAVYKQSAYVYVGRIPFELTEGDLLAVFAQYWDIVDVNLVRDKGTGKSKGYAFVAYEDQRSTNLIGECTRGDGCKFSHNAQRAANTGWGADDHKKSRRGDDKFGDSARNGEKAGHLDRARDSAAQDGRRSADKERRDSRVQVNNRDIDGHHKRTDSNSFDPVERALENRVERQEKESHHKDNRDRQGLEKRSRRHEFDSDIREHDDRRVEKGSRKTESVSYRRESRGKDKRSLHDRDSSPHRRRDR
ncbi:Zinc finger CCCH domain-containing protein 42 [Heracleum sosnowskyi]|uniref:Zinc finger CCCH domain-containing protein 42 n=1 Tax=Heracleum sosnowskyi TaxID=360622 RepID=A0AAD8IDK9_9APIA|nr:Zinc finger CCCH domain-containing protein 42 [Heracleum sosnowskyi]